MEISSSAVSTCRQDIWHLTAPPPRTWNYLCYLPELGDTLHTEAAKTLEQSGKQGQNGIYEAGWRLERWFHMMFVWRNEGEEAPW